MALTRGFDILPAIDLRGGRVVRLERGDFARESIFSDDPVAVARRFVDAGARWLHVVDLDGARTGSPVHGAVIESIVRAVGDRASVEVAGGLRDDASAGSVLATGAARAVIGTAAIADAAFAGRLIADHGPEAIAVAIDVREGLAVGRGWAADAPGFEASAVIERLADAGVRTFEVTAIERDGLLGGPDLELYRGLVGFAGRSIIASGGIATIDDVAAVRDAGCDGAIIGRAIYEGRIDLVTALALSGPRRGPRPPQGPSGAPR